jgi:hypothetical protein
MHTPSGHMAADEPTKIHKPSAEILTAALYTDETPLPDEAGAASGYT